MQQSKIEQHVSTLSTRHATRDKCESLNAQYNVRVREYSLDHSAGVSLPPVLLRDVLLELDLPSEWHHGRAPATPLQSSLENMVHPPSDTTNTLY
jgi:hypothetical protein